MNIKLILIHPIFICKNRGKHFDLLVYILNSKIHGGV